MRRLVRLLSCIAFILLLLQRAWPWNLAACVIAAGLFAVRWREATPEDGGRIRSPFWIAALFLNALLAFTFGRYWWSSNVLSRAAGALGIGRGSFIVILGALLAIFALPFSAGTIDWMWGTNEEGADIARLNRRISSRQAYCIYMLISAVFIVVLVYVSFSKDVWTDEQYSLELSQRGFLGSLRNEAERDIHPPLYHLLLAIVLNAARPFVAGLDIIYIAKLFSVVPFVILWILCATLVRREHGKYVAGLWAVCMIGMPNLAEYGVEIRMYSWGLLFVCLSFLWMNRVVRRGRIQDWALFVFFSLCAAYTHHFALLGAAVCYLTLLIWICCSDRGKLGAWFAASAATALGYLPWLVVILRQIQSVNEGFWIPRPTLNTVIENFFYVCGIRPLVMALALGAWGSLLYRVFRHRANDWKELFAFSGISMVAVVALIALVVSLISQPIFVERYLIPTMACLWLGLLLHIDGAANWRKIKAFVAVCLIVVSVLQVGTFAHNEIRMRNAAEETLRFFEECGEETVYISDDDGTSNLVAYLSGNVAYAWDGDSNKIRETTELLEEEPSPSIDAAEVLNIVDENERVYFVDNCLKEDDLLAVLEEMGLTCAYEGRHYAYLDCDYYRLFRGDGAE